VVSAVAWRAFAATIGLAGVSTAVAPLLRIPAGSMLVAFVVGAVLHATGMMTIELPQWLLAGSYALVGWTIGLRFTRPILVHVARLLPRIAASTLVLIAVCGGLGMVLSRVAGIDPLTAYLAMSPGAPIRLPSSRLDAVDMPFVMALQTPVSSSSCSSAPAWPGWSPGISIPEGIAITKPAARKASTTARNPPDCGVQQCPASFR